MSNLSNKNTAKKPKTDLSYRLGGAFSTAMVIYIVLALCFAVITQPYLTQAEFKDSALYILLNYFLVSLSLALGCGYSLIKNKLSPFKAVGFKLDWSFTIVILLVLSGSFFGLSKLNELVVSIFKGFGYVPDEIKLPVKTPANIIATIFFVAVVPAVCEEYLFRGLVLNSVKWLGGVKAVLISAGLFCIYHMSPAQTAYQFVMGVIYGIIALKSKSVLPTVILHFLNNLVVILLYYFFPNWVIGDAWQIVLMILGILVLGLAVYLCFVFNKEKHPSTPLEKPQKYEFGINIFPGIFICVVVWVSNLFI